MPTAPPVGERFMKKEERAVKTQSEFWNFSWVVIALLVGLLVAGILSFKTCWEQKQEQLREPPARARSNSKSTV